MPGLGVSAQGVVWSGRCTWSGSVPGLGGGIPGLGGVPGLGDVPGPGILLWGCTWSQVGYLPSYPPPEQNS